MALGVGALSSFKTDDDGGEDFEEDEERLSSDILLKRASGDVGRDDERGSATACIDDCDCTFTSEKGLFGDPLVLLLPNPNDCVLDCSFCTDTFPTVLS